MPDYASMSIAEAERRNRALDLEFARLQEREILRLIDRSSLFSSALSLIADPGIVRDIEHARATATRALAAAEAANQ